MHKTVELVEDKDDDKKPTKVGGYKTKDILKAPLKHVEPVKTESKTATQNKPVVILIAAAAILGVCGLVLSLFGQVLFGGFILLIAALLVVAGVFLPVGT